MSEPEVVWIATEPWRPPWPRLRWAVPLFLLTLLSTTVVGARLAYNYALGRPGYFGNTDLFPFVWVWHHPRLLAAGLPFSLTLMAILLAHELGHFFACRHYRLDCTWPMFLPAPTLLGTLGAFIRIRAPFRGRRELFDVGIAGPLAGIAVTLPVLIGGLWLSRPLSPAQAALAHQAWIQFGTPPLLGWLAARLHPGVPMGALALSPVALAGWTGLLVTMLNLIPGAQLDGGHIAYALSPRLHAAASWSALVLLVWAGWRFWPGWWFFAAFIALLRVRHPALPPSAAAGRLGALRGLLALLALAIFLLSFMPAPVFAP